MSGLIERWEAETGKSREDNRYLESTEYIEWVENKYIKSKSDLIESRSLSFTLAEKAAELQKELERLKGNEKKPEFEITHSATFIDSTIVNSNLEYVDKLKAENEALQKEVERLEIFTKHTVNIIRTMGLDHNQKDSSLFTIMHRGEELLKTK
jgi:hypothetical protein